MLWLNAAGETSVKSSGSAWRQAAVARCFGFGARSRQDEESWMRRSATSRLFHVGPEPAATLLSCLSETYETLQCSRHRRKPSR